MSPIAFLRQMLATGMDLETAMLAAEAFERSSEEGHRTLVADLLDRLAVDQGDPAKERKRARDAERMAAKREQERQSRDVARRPATETTSPAPPASPSSLPPRPPIPTTPTPPEISTRSRKADDFDQFWVAYPRKVGKDAARKAYDAAVRRIEGPDPPAVILGALERVKATWADAQFIPHPTTWLNQGRWQDEPETITPRQALKVYDGSPQRPQVSKQADNMARAFAGAELASQFLADRR